MGHLAAADASTPSQQLHQPTYRTPRRNVTQIQYDLNGNEIKEEVDEQQRDAVALYAFDRESFMAEPLEFVKGVEEDLMLGDTLPRKSCRTIV